jgi:glycosyltransferase involved in cell wall biosynthesis
VQNLETTRPEVSVVLTVYNRAKYLERCIYSLINQSYKNWELIAVDDGSEDDSPAMLKNFESLYNRIKVFRHENKKLPLSRNKGIEMSSGTFITFIDSDDEYEEKHLEERIKFMKENPAVDLIHGGVKIIGDEYVRDKDNPHKLIHLSECAIGATFFGKRKVFEDLKGFKNIHYSEDSEFLQRAESKFNVRKVDFDTYKYYRDIPDSITNSYVP